MANQAPSKISSPQRTFLINTLLSLTGLGMMLVLSGCGGPNPQSLVPTNTANMANAGTIKTELLDTSVLQTVQRINPFESQLPGQQLKMADPKSDPTLAEGLPDLPTPIEEVKDPFSGLEIGGIVYRKSSPMAILRSGSSGANAGLGGVVRQGDTFMVDDVKIIVAKIDKNSITLKAPSLPSGSNSKILTVPSLIGYASTASGGASSFSDTPKGGSRPGLENADPKAVAEIDRMEGNIDVPQAIMDLLKEKLQKTPSTP